MKTIFTRLALLAGLVGAAALRPAQAQTVYVPVAVTGYNADVIANGAGAVNASTTNSVDRGNSTVRWCFANHTFVSPAGISLLSQPALPDNGLIASISTPGLTFQLAAATANNSLRIDGAAAGTLALTTPQACSEVMVLATEGNGSTAPKTFTVTFTDGTTQVFSNIVVPDWFGGTITPAILVGSRVGYVDNSVDIPVTDPRLYEVRLSLLVANYGKLVQSVGVAKTSTDPVLNVMGISLGSNCLGVPVAGAAQAAVGTAAPATTVTVCPGGPAVLSLAGATVSGGLTYQWQVSTNGGTTFTDIAGATTNPYTVRPTASAQYRARVTCTLQASTSAAATVNVAPSVATVAYSASATQPTSFCQSGTAPVVTASPAGGRFTTTSAGLVLDATTGTINLAASTPGTYTITYTVTTPCPATGSTTVSITNTVAAVVYSNPTYCKGSSANPTPAYTPGGGTFRSTAGLTINASTGTIDLNASAAGTYIVTYVSGGQCPGTATTSVVVSQTVARVAYSARDTTSYCQGGTGAVLTATPAGGSFSSTSGLALNASTGAINLANSTAGLYAVSYTVTSTLCPATAVTYVLVGAPAPAFAYPCAPFNQGGPGVQPALSAVLPAGGRFTATPTGLAVNTITGALDLASSRPGTYMVTYTSAGRCTSTTSVQVLDQLIFPNVITPNGDGKNDVLRPTLANVSGYHLQVFSRWGRRVYDGRDAAQGWTATDNSAGTYYYLIDYTDCTGATRSYRNWIEVIK